LKKIAEGNPDEEKIGAWVFIFPHGNGNGAFQIPIAEAEV
jgi:hypothetical protein